MAGQGLQLYLGALWYIFWLRWHILELQTVQFSWKHVKLQINRFARRYFFLLFTFRCLSCRVWHPPKLGKARRHIPSPLSQSINNRPSPLNFQHFFSSPLSLSPGLSVGSSFPSHDPSLEPQPTSGRSLIFAMIDSIGPVSTLFIWLETCFLRFCSLSPSFEGVHFSPWLLESLFFASLTCAS